MPRRKGFIRERSWDEKSCGLKHSFHDKDRLSRANVCGANIAHCIKKAMMIANDKGSTAKEGSRPLSIKVATIHTPLNATGAKPVRKNRRSHCNRPLLRPNKQMNKAPGS